MCFSLVPTDQFHYLVGMVGCSPVSLYDLQQDEGGLWDYWDLASPWELQLLFWGVWVSASVGSGGDWGGCCLAILGCGAWGPCGGGS